MLSEGLPGLTYQVSPETTEASGTQGPIRKPGPAEGIRRARMELNFQAFCFTIVKTLCSGAQRTALPQYKKLSRKRSPVGDPEYMRETYTAEPTLQA